MSRLQMVLGAVILLAATACGGAGGADASAAAGGMQLSIASPAEGASVSVPFTVKLDSSVPLGNPSTGEHHVHVFFDGNDSEYTLAYGDSVRITQLPAGVGPGEHVLNASLRNADHSDTGVEAQVDVTVQGSGGSGGSGGDGAPGYSY